MPGHQAPTLLQVVITQGTMEGFEQPPILYLGVHTHRCGRPRIPF